ncbi:hypothetical protein GCM10011494_10120 [Novosphingobium endophyticum]|uniref:Cupin type-2 domain-containing protein n=1 Tax=Novosphingobium endophyticum TaxID=1955250 RepID=A0A916TQL6_9SPHN|nr:cupin domain-containing protein [Novosphingobium endophyticum]GGB93669.1 hypothetical protein GCM10011494_10120 [Novosphingobium endophyticum]
MRLALRWPLLSGVILGIFGTTAVTTFAGTSPAKSTSQVLFENEMVRVKQAIFMPGDREAPMHTHDLAHVGIPLDDGRLIFRYPDGKSETLDLKTGTVGFREANVTHQAINVGKNPLRVIEVELKRSN